MEEFVERTSDARPPSYIIFVAFFVYSLPFVYSDFMQKKNFSRKWWEGAGAIKQGVLYYKNNFKIFKLVKHSETWSEFHTLPFL